MQATISAFWLVKNMSINPQSVQKSVIEFENDWQPLLWAQTNKMVGKKTNKDLNSSDSLTTFQYYYLIIKQSAKLNNITKLTT